MKKLIFILLLGIFSLPSRLLAETVMNATCPIMEGERTKEKFFVDHQGKRVYFCCRSCIKKFNKNPQKYLKNLKEA